MQTVNLVQGSPEWHAHRAKHFNASDAPAMMGVSKYTTRDELLAQLKTGIAKEVDKETEKRFEDGHKYEALARPLAEKIFGTDLYPVVGVNEKLSASFDGLDIFETYNFEHKSLNDELRQAEDDAYYLPLMYRVQMEHQALVCNSITKTLFMASKWKKVPHVTEHFVLVDSKGFMNINGTPEYYELEEERHWWYIPDKSLQEKIIAGWAQFEKDLETFVPPTIVEKVVAEEVQALPVPSVVVKGEITASNLLEITPKFDAYLAGIKTSLSTDQDFADAEANAKNCREMGKRIEALQENIIAQMVSVNEVNGTLENYKKAFNEVGLRLEKAVKLQKDAIKQKAIMDAKDKFGEHLRELENDCDMSLHILVSVPDFAEAIKGVSKLESMHSRINDALAQGKSQATQIANDVKTKKAFINASISGYEHLIKVNELATRDLDYIKLHIQSVKDAEDKRKADHEAQIKAKAEAEARAKVEAEAKPVDRVVEPTKTILPPAVEAEFGKQFVDGLDDFPTPNDIINTIAGAYGVNPATARQYVINTYEFITKKAA